MMRALEAGRTDPTASLTVEEVEKVTTGAPTSGSGSQRDVWLLGDDLVVKRVKDAHRVDGKVRAGSDYNAKELKAYERLRSVLPRTVPVGGDPERTVTLAVPEMAMVGEYIVARRAPGRHIEPRGEDRHLLAEYHTIRDAAYDLDLFDMHWGNFLWDDDTRTAWMVDIAL